MPSCQDSGVHGDIEVPEDGDPLISPPDLVGDPALKLVTDYAEDDVAAPRLWHLLQLLENWEVLHHLLHRESLLDDETHLQRLILGHPEGLDVVVMDKLSRPGYEIPHEILKENIEVKRTVTEKGGFKTYNGDRLIGR